MRQKHILAAVLSIFGLSVFAQLNSSVNVEGEYLPLVIETERINTYPKGYRFDLPPVSLDYELSGIVSEFNPELLTMGVTGRQTNWPWIKRKGWIDFKMGSYLNTRLDAGYYILSDSVNTLLGDLKFNSTSLYRTKNIPETYAEPSRRKLHNGSVGLSYSRLIDSEGVLEAKVRYGLDYFNYYGTTFPLSGGLSGNGNFSAPTQTVNRLDGYAGYASSVSPIRGWHAEAGVKYLGYRRLYTPKTSSKGDKETLLNAGAGYRFSLSDFSAIAIDASGDFLFFGKKDPGIFVPALTPRRNYGIVTLTPAYRYSGRDLSVTAGADVALSYDAMGAKSDQKFGPVHFAPDVAIAYRSKAGVGISLSATGGLTPASLLLKEDFDRYGLPWLLSTTPVYTPVDARLDLNVGPFAGFAASVGFRYAVVKNVPLGGWYQAFLGTYLPGASGFDAANFLDPYMQGINLHGLNVGLDLRYAYGNIAEVSFESSYTPQKGKTGIFNGFDRPRWLLNASALVHPVRKLAIEVGYEYRGVRNCYFMSSTAEGMRPAAFRLPDITDLKAKISYKILDNLDVYCSGENLLNRHVDILPGLQCEGVAISGGVYWEF